MALLFFLCFLAAPSGWRARQVASARERLRLACRRDDREGQGHRSRPRIFCDLNNRLAPLRTFFRGSIKPNHYESDRGFIKRLFKASSTTLADLLTLLFLADPGSAVRTSLRT